MDFQNGVINVQTAGYNGTHRVEVNLLEALILASTNPQYDNH